MRTGSSVSHDTDIRSHELEQTALSLAHDTATELSSWSKGQLHGGIATTALSVESDLPDRLVGR